LALRGRIALEKTGLRRRSLANRKVVCISETPTGDTLLDEALKHIKDTKPLETTQTWIDYLSGMSALSTAATSSCCLIILFFWSCCCLGLYPKVNFYELLAQNF